MEKNKNNFDLQINEDEFQKWYKNWREEGMDISPNDSMFDIWMDMKIDNEFNDIKTLLGKVLWYAVDQTQNELCTDVWYCGVTIKHGKVTREDNKCFHIEGYDKPISKESLSVYVFLNKDLLLFSLHYDGDSLYSGKQIKSCFSHGEFIEEDEVLTEAENEK